MLHFEFCRPLRMASHLRVNSHWSCLRPVCKLNGASSERITRVGGLMDTQIWSLAAPAGWVGEGSAKQLWCQPASCVGRGLHNETMSPTYWYKELGLNEGTKRGRELPFQPLP